MTSNAHERDTGPGVYAAALVALTSHIAEHQLAFKFVDNPDNGQPLEVFVADHVSWLSTVHIITEHNDDAITVDGRLYPVIKTVWEVALPDTGTRVRVRTWRDIPFAHGPVVADLRVVS
jgi:hypothetical protein